jgi:hypothetical protein
MKNIQILALLIVSFVSGSGLFANTYYSVASGSAASASTWGTICGGASCGCFPSGGDNVVICSGTTVTSNVDVQIGSGGFASTLTIQSGTTLNMGANFLEVKNGGILTVSGSLVVGSLQFDNGSTVDVMPGGTVQDNGAFTNKNNSNSITVDGGLSVAGAASFGNGSTVSGNGTVTISGTSSGAGTVFGGSPGCSGCVLPIELLSFSGSANNGLVNLTWVSATEADNEYYTLERTLNGFNYEKIAQIAGAGNSSSLRTYTFTDESPAQGINYYRLKQTDFDGKSSYLGITTVSVSMPALSKRMQVLPNPFHDNGKLIFSSDFDGACPLILMDATGRVLKRISIDAQKGSNAFDLNFPELEAGMYFLSLNCNEQSMLTCFIRN